MDTLLGDGACTVDGSGFVCICGTLAFETSSGHSSGEEKKFVARSMIASGTGTSPCERGVNGCFQISSDDLHKLMKAPKEKIEERMTLVQQLYGWEESMDKMRMSGYIPRS